MAGAVAVAWASCLVILANNAYVVHGGLGVNWGTQASHPLLPPTVVQLLKDNEIKKVKLFDSDFETVSAFAGTKIQVMLGIPNDQLLDLSSEYVKAEEWVKENVTDHIKNNGGVNIRYVAVGNEAFLKSYNGSFHKTTLPAMRNVQKALNEAGFGHKIKVTTPLNSDVYDSSTTKPSGGNFRPDIRTHMKQIAQFLYKNKSPFVANIYPFLSLYQNKNFPIGYAFIDGGGPTINDRGKQYNNAFDANYDTLVWSLRKHGYDDMEIVVGEIGWPTDGNANANTDMAKKFYGGFLRRMASKKGTPMKPDQEMEAYLFGLLDENMKSSAPGAFERHWGIFTFDGKPKFPMDLTEKGYPTLLVPAKEVNYLESKWCVYDAEDTPDTPVDEDERLPKRIRYACQNSDCTAMEDGGSCGKLTPSAQASYAFNMFYQMNNQEEEACDFEGSAKIVTKNASTGACLFPIQIELSGGKMNSPYTGVSVVAGALFSLLVL